MSNQLELINKGYFSLAKDIYIPEEYLDNFKWFGFWLKRNYNEISEHLLTIALPVIFFLFFLKNKINHKFIFNNKLGLYLFLISGFLFWLNFSPVYRFAIHIFLTLIFVIFISFLISKNFSKKNFLNFCNDFLFFIVFQKIF